jgi:hypothetical protein
VQIVFDENMDGTLSRDEFQQIMKYQADSVLSARRMGSMERKTVERDFNHSGIFKLLFGRDGKGRLSLGKPPCFHFNFELGI